MDLPIRWSPRAALHIEEICTYIERDSVQYATLFPERIIQTVESIPDNPRMGRIVPEYGEENLRERIYQGYRKVYRITESSIEIVAICHGARRIENVIE